MRSKKSTDKSGDAVNSNVKAITPADVTLPFADDRSVLKKVFVRNAVPREDDYQRLLTQHNDMAYSLGLEKGTLSESVQGQGLVLNSDSKKLEIKLTTSNGGLTVDSSGLALKLKTTVEPNGYKAGVIKADGDGLWINISKEGDRRGLMSYKAGENAVLGIDHDDSLAIIKSGIDAGKLSVNSGNGLTLNGTSKKLEVNLTATSGGLTFSESGGLKINLDNSGSPGNFYAGAIKSTNDGGLWINVGAGQERKGLKPHTTQYGGALGIDHDDSLLIRNDGDNKGKLGVKNASLIKLMGEHMKAEYYAENEHLIAYMRLVDSNNPRYPKMLIVSASLRGLTTKISNTGEVVPVKLGDRCDFNEKDTIYYYYDSHNCLAGFLVEQNEVIIGSTLTLGIKSVANNDGDNTRINVTIKAFP